VNRPSLKPLNGVKEIDEILLVLGVDTAGLGDL